MKQTKIYLDGFGKVWSFLPSLFSVKVNSAHPRGGARPTPCPPPATQMGGAAVRL